MLSEQRITTGIRDIVSVVTLELEAAEKRRGQARDLFRPLPALYDALAEFLSLGQNARWRRRMVTSALKGVPGMVLDVACGTAGVAIQITRRSDADVVAIDLSSAMLAVAKRRVNQKNLDTRVSLVSGTAEQMPFADGTFDALTFTYLLRYVEDPRATLKELARVVRPGGVIASLEFAVPKNLVWRFAWRIYTRLVLPILGFMFGAGWYKVGRFLGPSIEGHYRRYPIEWHVKAWSEAGIAEVELVSMSLGGGIVMWGNKSG